MVLLLNRYHTFPEALAAGSRRDKRLFSLPGRFSRTWREDHLVAEAVRAALHSANVLLAAIECLACGTFAPDQMIPNHACMVHGELGNPPCEVAATAGVCCSSMTAFKYGYMNVLAGLIRITVIAGSKLASAHLRAEHFQAEMEAKARALEFERVEEKYGNESGAIDWLLPHYSSGFFRQPIYDCLNHEEQGQIHHA